MIALRTLVLLTAAAGVSAQAGWLELVGKPVPEFHADAWVSTGSEPVSVASLRGKVFLLEFFAAT